MRNGHLRSMSFTPSIPTVKRAFGDQDTMHQHSKSSDNYVYKPNYHRKLDSLVINKSESANSSNSNSTNNSMMHIHSGSEDYGTVRWDCPPSPKTMMINGGTEEAD